jgi:hypothetical protein
MTALWGFEITGSSGLLFLFFSPKQEESMVYLILKVFRKKKNLQLLKNQITTQR